MSRKLITHALAFILGASLMAVGLAAYFDAEATQTWALSQAAVMRAQAERDACRAAVQRETVENGK